MKKQQSDQEQVPDPGVFAPGSILLSGDYAVFDGGVAIAAAVNKGSAARWADTAHGSQSREVEWARNQAELRSSWRSGRVPKHLRLESTLPGMNCSVAEVVATAGAVYGWHGFHVSDRQVRRLQIYPTAAGAYPYVGPNGSGVEIAASVYGGFVSFRSPLRVLSRWDEGNETISELTPPDSLAIRVIHMNRRSRTEELFIGVLALFSHDSGTAEERLAVLREEAEQFAEAFSLGDTDEVIRCGIRYSKAMAALGHAAKAPIVDERLVTVADIAKELGGSAKPSNTMGQDVSVGFFDDESKAMQFEARCQERGFPVIPLSLGGAGVTQLDR